MIRHATDRDLPAMLAIYRPYVENTTYSFEYDVPCLRTFTQRFYDHVAQFPWLVWEENGVVLGYRWCAEVSIYLDPQVHGRGIGRQLYAQLEDILTRQGYRVAYALITTENPGSVAFHEKLGYVYHSTFADCGYKMGRWLGVIWLQKRLNPNGTPTAFPKKWTEVV